jgi:hypothetical protein
MQQANQKKDTIDGEDEGIISSCFSEIVWNNLGGLF